MINPVNFKLTSGTIALMIILLLALIISFSVYKVGFKKGLNTRETIINKYQNEPDQQDDRQTSNTLNDRTDNHQNPLITPPVIPSSDNNLDGLPTGAEIRKMILENSDYSGSLEDLKNVTDEQLVQLFRESIQNN